MTRFLILMRQNLKEAPYDRLTFDWVEGAAAGPLAHTKCPDARTLHSQGDVPLSLYLSVCLPSWIQCHISLFLQQLSK